MIPDCEADLAIFRNWSSLVAGSVSIVDGNWCGRCMESGCCVVWWMIGWWRYWYSCCPLALWSRAWFSSPVSRFGCQWLDLFLFRSGRQRTVLVVAVLRATRVHWFLLPLCIPSIILSTTSSTHVLWIQLFRIAFASDSVLACTMPCRVHSARMV